MGPDICVHFMGEVEGPKDPRLLFGIKKRHCRDLVQCRQIQQPLVLNDHQIFEPKALIFRKICAQRDMVYLLARSDQGADVLVGQYLRERGLIR